MRTFLLVFVVLVVFVVGAITQLPLSLVTDRVGGPVEFGSVEGTIWDGKIEDIEVNGQVVGTATMKINMLSLLRGAPEATASFEGRGVEGEGTVSFDGDVFEMRDAMGIADLAKFGLVDAFGQKLRGTVQADIRYIVFSRMEGCKMADLTASTDAISRSLGAYAERGFLLSGQGRCEGEELVVPLSGSGPDASIDAEMRLNKNGEYISRLAVDPTNDEMGAFLEGMGFRQEGDAYVTERRGRLDANL